VLLVPVLEDVYASILLPVDFQSCDYPIKRRRELNSWRRPKGTQALGAKIIFKNFTVNVLCA
jgi:hypothetical protein